MTALFVVSESTHLRAAGRDMWYITRVFQCLRVKLSCDAEVFCVAPGNE